MKLSRKVAVLGSVAVAVAVGGAAMALWSSTGSGSATAGSVAIQNSAIAAAANGADLYPGATKTITVTVDNPNPYAVNLLQIGGVNAEDQDGCEGSNVSVATLGDGTNPVAPTGGEGTSIAAKSGNTNGSRTYTMSVSMASAAPDGCAGTSFTFNFSGASLVQAG
ncbi:MAG TPA: hypothetical protein VM938_12795 [Acidimicrobiales bacterium]|nr:hypothetical protein [Acidimicrobiales bacterium]